MESNNQNKLTTKDFIISKFSNLLKDKNLEFSFDKNTLAISDIDDKQIELVTTKLTNILNLLNNSDYKTELDFTKIYATASDSAQKRNKILVIPFSKISEKYPTELHKTGELLKNVLSKMLEESGIKAESIEINPMNTLEVTAKIGRENINAANVDIPVLFQQHGISQPEFILNYKDGKFSISYKKQPLPVIKRKLENYALGVDKSTSHSL